MSKSYPASGSTGKPRRKEGTMNLPTARRMFPLVRRIAEELRDATRLAATLNQRNEHLERFRRELVWQERQMWYRIREQLSQNEQVLAETRRELNDLGVTILDAYEGRVGFPTLVSGERAYFTWQPDEDDIRYWQYPGDSERRPIPKEWDQEADLRVANR